ncbi:hypothetical protein BROC_01674 [Candidatus Brocadiaceae bacterium]|nr:hypothetical protein BROC_01674 [Candidatus Brocadiaceae bacterium]
MKAKKLIVVLVVMVYVAIMPLTLGAYFYCAANRYGESSNWRISAATIPAKILWQHTEQRVPPNSASASTTGFASGNEEVLYFRTPYFSICDMGRSIVAYDVQTGKDKWQYAPQNANMRDLVSFDEGYLVIVDQFVERLDNECRRIWLNGDFPSRSVLHGHVSDDVVYLPSHDRVYVLSLSTGKMLTIKDIPNVVDFWGDYQLIGIDASVLEVSRVDSKTNVAQFSHWDPTVIRTDRVERKFTERIGDLLLVYNPNKRDRIRVYQLSTGQMLWERQLDYHSAPIIGQGMVIVYTDQGIEIIQLFTGETIGTIYLERESDNSVERDQLLQDIWVAANGNMISIYFISTAEIITIEVDYPH